MFEKISPSHPHSFYWIFELVISYYVRDLPLANELNLRFIGISRLKRIQKILIPLYQLSLVIIN